jgi:enamine deaminase RidA (YjgF/YER057c/UK114 family)
MPESSSPQSRLAELGLVLPPAPKPAGLYKPWLVVGSQVYVSGHGPLREDGTLITGRVGEHLDVEAGKAAARQVGLSILATLVRGLGSLDRIARVVKLLGLVNATPGFTQQPLVINGCSELFAEIWGPERGVGVRSAVGAGSLPGDMAVEIEAVFELA